MMARDFNKTSPTLTDSLNCFTMFMFRKGTIRMFILSPTRFVITNALCTYSVAFTVSSITLPKDRNFATDGLIFINSFTTRANCIVLPLKT